ncbi:tRNA preQ1(34) S-adenosylmethionine ribosyltransferase-isomerase QueA [Pendulispora brunnea]|uniref:S-adenosylmethionine:tRNA ribosyltransferase-isomerase n=1 Tax=Pendulispora brunnea TaxID=2905690 RepID=A0ABZ2KLD1_9BACT
MRIEAFDYDLPPDRIAQYPTPEREQARLLVVPPDSDALENRGVAELAELIPEGALVVVNDTRVIPARLLGVKADTGGKVEIFLVRFVEARTLEIPGGDPREAEVWLALGKASKPLRFGSDVIAGNVIIRLLGRGEDGLLEVGVSTMAPAPIRSAIEAEGHVPLPPYIKRGDEPLDQERYQTVFARVPGALAAPTAGLHLSRALLGRLAVRGCELASVTLHVGLGTFQPVQVEDLDQHPMHSETFEISRTTASAIARARERGKPVVAIGTTVVRALESAASPDRDGHVIPTHGETRLLIQPGYQFRVVDMLVTNFHLPRSTLLALVCAFGGYERVLAAYRHAVREDYRFFSYGDAMLLTRAT